MRPVAEAPPAGISESRSRVCARRRAACRQQRDGRRGAFVSLHHQCSDHELADLAAGADRRALVQVLPDVLEADRALQLRQRDGSADRRACRRRSPPPWPRDAAAPWGRKRSSLRAEPRCRAATPRLVTIGGRSTIVDASPGRLRTADVSAPACRPLASGGGRRASDARRRQRPRQMTISHSINEPFARLLRGDA